MPKRHHYPYYVKLDENILFNNTDLNRLVDKHGWEGFGIYIGLLTLFRNYSKTNYAIPNEDLQIIAKNTFRITVKKFNSILVTLNEIGWILNYSEDGVQGIFSKRRQEELLAQEEVTKAQSEGGKKGMQKRYGYKSEV